MTMAIVMALIFFTPALITMAIKAKFDLEFSLLFGWISIFSGVYLAGCAKALEPTTAYLIMMILITAGFAAMLYSE